MAASRTDLSKEDLHTLGRKLQAPAQKLISDTVELLPRAAAWGGTEFDSDLERILTAACNLVGLVETHLLPPSADAKPRAPLPVPVREEDEEETETDLTEKQGIQCIHSRVLVVDDNEVNRDMLCRRLEREGYVPVVAENGREALELIREGGLDLVLLDILMPEVDGYQVLEEIKSSPELRDLPVIMISALDEIESVVRCIEMGAEDYLPKPFNPVLLHARVGACLEKKRLRDQELDYLRNVATVTQAAQAVETGAFDSESLTAVAKRTDALGQLARVFQRMAHEIQVREERLKQQVQDLRVQIDETRKARQVEEITESDYFQNLQRKAQDLRSRARTSR